MCKNLKKGGEVAEVVIEKHLEQQQAMEGGGNRYIVSKAHKDSDLLAQAHGPGTR